MHVILAILAIVLGAQDAALAPAAAPEEICPSLPVGTPLKIAVMESVVSRSARNDDMFRIALAEPLIIDGKTVIAAGTAGMGQVIQASHTKFMKNEPGELLVAARYLELGGKHLPLRSFRIVAHDEYKDPRPMSYMTNVDIPKGSVATAKVAGECVAPAPMPVPPPTK